MLNNMKIRTRLILFTAILLLTLIITAATSLLLTRDTLEALQKISSDHIPSVVAMTNIRFEISFLAILEKNYIISADSTLESEVILRSARVEQALADAAPLMIDEKTEFDELLAAWRAYLPVHDRILQLAREGKPVDAQRLSVGEGAQLFNNIAEKITAVVDLDQQSSAEYASAALDQVLVTMPTIILITLIISISFGIGASMILIRGIIKPLQALQIGAEKIGRGEMNYRIGNRSLDELGIVSRTFDSMAENLEITMASHVAKEYLEKILREYRNFVAKVASGDLTDRLDIAHFQRNEEDDLYQLGVNLNIMVENLSDLASQLLDTSTSVSAAAAEILAATTQQIASSTEQDAAVTQTMTTVEEVRMTVKQTAERAQTVADTSRQSVEISRNGQESVTDTIDGMKLIRQRVEGIAENILMLSERTQQIGEITDTVNEIASQSKLLALNASIEAARAGEEGKGFAVVAMEVRQLAEQSRDATMRIRDILNQIQQATNTAVMVTEEGSKGTENGMKLVERAGNAIQKLAMTLSEAAQAATQIAASTYQQTNGMDQLAMAMTSIKQATTQTAASTRQAERSAQDLNEMARRMESVVKLYRLNGNR